MAAANLSAVERIKAASRGLRGTIVESLADPVTGGLADDDQHLLKFHGSYQQYDRDSAEARRQAKLEPAYSFMIRTRLPGGLVSPAQWLALDALATRHANGTLRLTSRQAFQLHGVLKGDLKRTIAAMNAAKAGTNADVFESTAQMLLGVAADLRRFGWVKGPGTLDAANDNTAPSVVNAMLLDVHTRG